MNPGWPPEYRVTDMTGTDERAQGRAPDPDSTVVMPSLYSAGHDATVLLPTVAVDRDAAPSVGYDVNPAEATATTKVGDATGTSVARHGAVMAVGSVISRVTGFLRTAAIGAAIGVVAVGNDYNLANTLPGMVYELLLGGVLSSVVIPLLVRARTRDADRGEAYTQRLLSLAAVFLAAATVVAVVCAPLFTALLSNNRTTPADGHLITTLSYLLLPMIFFYGMAALFAAVLNTRGHFALPTFAPILNNLVVIAMTTVFLVIPVAHRTDATSLSAAQIAVLGLGTTLGIVIQAVGLWPALRKVAFRWRWRWDFRELHLRELARVSAWMLAYVLISQLGVVAVLKLAQMAADNGKDAAGPAIFNNAFLIFMMAHGIVAVSIITALMPRMAAAAAEHRHADLAHQLSLGTRLTAVVLLPATVGYVVLGRPLAVTLFEWGQYEHPQAVATGWVIAVAGLGLVPFAISQLQLFAFYAMPDTKTPALMNIPVVGLRILVDVGLYVVLPAGGVAAGLMAGNAVSFVLAAVIGYALLRRRLGALELRRVFRTLGQLALAAVLAGVLALLVVMGFTAMWGEEKWASVAQLVVGAAVLGVAYVGAAFALRVPEIRELGAMVRSRVGR
jgi:putative peptidoglycan lipid II flippase